MNSYSIRQGGVHVGVWIDQSNGDWLLTLPAREAAYLVAATTLFITILGSRVWSMQQFFIHDSMARERCIDGLGLQLRHLLRNGGSPTGTIWEMGKLWWAWRTASPTVERLKRRMLYAVLWPMLNVVAFAAVGILSSRIAGKDYASNHVLLKQKNCGIVGPNIGVNDTRHWQPQRYMIQTALNDTQAARQYAHDCYGSESGMSQCSMFPSQSIPYSTEVIDCPFGKTPAGTNLCQPNEGKAMRLTTPSLNTGKIFGVNVAAKNQIEIKKSLTCAPIRISEYIRTEDSGTDNATTYLDLGLMMGVSPYVMSHKPRAKQDNVGYQISSLSAWEGGVWAPVDALNVPHGDISVTVVAGNSIQYLAPVTDPWFSANQYNNVTNAYMSDAELSAIACIDQYQICNPATGDASTCTILGSSHDVVNARFDIGLSKYQDELATRMLALILGVPIWQTIDFEGVGAMLASRSVAALMSNGLPDNQWELEVRDWFETSLAMIQAGVVQYVNNFDQDVLGIYASVDNFTQVGVPESYLCNSQRVRNTGGYVSFSFTWILVILYVGTVIIILSFVIGPVYGLVNRKSRKRDVVRTADSQFQILRKILACQEPGDGLEWSRKMHDVPITSGRQMFVLPELQQAADNGDSTDYLPTRSEATEKMRMMTHFTKQDQSRSGSARSNLSEIVDGDEDVDVSSKAYQLPHVTVSERFEAWSLMDGEVDEVVHEREYNDNDKDDGVESVRSSSRRTDSRYSVSALTDG